MLQPCPGRSVSETYRLPFAALHLPRYPRYRDDERVADGYRYVYQRSQRYLRCQAARFVLFGGDTPTLVGSGVVDPTRDLSDWWNGFYREHFRDQCGEVVKYSGDEGYREYLAAHPELRVISPHPFDSAHIPTSRYYLREPTLVARLNDKGCMGELSPHAVPYQVFNAAEFASEIWRDTWQLPFVIKLTTPSGGGDGVAICHDEGDLREALRRFAGQPVKFERYIEDIRKNINVNLCVTPEGEIQFLGGSVQRIDEGAKYGGNCIDFRWQPDDALRAICAEIASNAWQLGWHGVCGLDIIEDSSGEYFFIDPNFRLNGSTPFYFMRAYFATHFRTPHLETGYFTFGGDPVTLLETFRKEIESKALAPIGIYHDPREDAFTRVYAALATEGDLDSHAQLREKLARKRLVAGIHL